MPRSRFVSSPRTRARRLVVFDKSARQVRVTSDVETGEAEDVVESGLIDLTVVMLAAPEHGVDDEERPHDRGRRGRDARKAGTKM